MWINRDIISLFLVHLLDISLQNMETIKNLIYHSYETLFSSKNRVQKEQILFTIIELKNSNPGLANIKQSKYKDFKDFCVSYITNKNTLDYNHSTYSENIILDLLTTCKFTTEETYHLLVFIQSLYKDSHLNHTNIEAQIIQHKILIARQHRKWFKFILLTLSQKTTYTVIALLFFFTMELLILLPAPCEVMEIISFEKVNYCSDSIINHIVNALSLHIEFLDGATLSAATATGVILIGGWNLIYIILIVNILFKNLLTRIEIYDPE